MGVLTSCHLDTAEIYNRTRKREVLEANPVSVTFAEYWKKRASQFAFEIEETERVLRQSASEDDWSAFSARMTKFLRLYLTEAAKAVYWPLKDLWQPRLRDLSVLWNLESDLKKDGRAELLIPVIQAPATFVRIPARGQHHPEQISLSYVTDKRIEIGNPIIAISWREADPLFLILPGEGYISFDTITYSKGENSWNSGEAIAKAFLKTSEKFRRDLMEARKQLTRFGDSWHRDLELTRLKKASSRLEQVATAWTKIYIPDRQKIELLRGCELFEANDPAAPRGLLLTGPSGTGKTLIAETLADTLGCDLQALSATDLREQNLGASGKRVREVWEHARSHQPSIIFLDRCEAMLSRRGAAETDVIATDVVRSFLAEWDRVKGGDRIWVMGATDHPEFLDDAARSQFGWEVELSLPGDEERIGILTQELQALGLSGTLPGDAVPMTQSMSGRDLQQLVRSARSLAYPSEPGREHFLEAAASSKRAHNTKVDAHASWETLVLNDAVLDRLKLTCSLLQDADRWQRQGVSIPQNLLLIGPPGVGKTQIARTLANESGLTFLAATTAEIKGKFLGHSGNSVKQFFERARGSAPAILFLDELDIIAPDRSLSGSTDQLTDEIVGQLLQEMDGIQAHAGHVFLMAATNHLNHIDPAIRSRFTDRLVIPLPDHAARARLLTVLLSGKKLECPTESGVTLLANLSDGKGWSGRELAAWVRLAEQHALMRAISNGGPESFLIELKDFDTDPFQSI